MVKDQKRSRNAVESSSTTDTDETEDIYRVVANKWGNLEEVVDQPWVYDTPAASRYPRSRSEELAVPRTSNIGAGHYISENDISTKVTNLFEGTTFVDSSVKITATDVAASLAAERVLTKVAASALSESDEEDSIKGRSKASGRQRQTSGQAFHPLDDDPSLYRPIGAVLAKRCIPLDVCRSSSSLLQLAATKMNRRHLTNGGNEAPETGIVGYYDYSNNPTQYKCRETEFTRRNLPAFAYACEPLIRRLDEVYALHAPRHHQLQKETIPEAYKLFGTCFSTITVNKNFRTAAHVDRGDFKSGLGVVAVLESSGFSGCYLAIPKLNLAFEMEAGDAVLFDTSFLHGNTEVYVQVTEDDLADILNQLRERTQERERDNGHLVEKRPRLETLIRGTPREIGGQPSLTNVQVFVPNIIRKRGNRTYIEVPFGYRVDDPRDPAFVLASILYPRWKRISIVAYLRSGLATTMCWRDRAERLKRANRVALIQNAQLAAKADNLDRRDHSESEPQRFVTDLCAAYCAPNRASSSAAFSTYYTPPSFADPGNESEDPEVNAGNKSVRFGVPMYVPKMIAQTLTQTQTEALVFAVCKLAYPVVPIPRLEADLRAQNLVSPSRTSFTKSVSGCIIALAMGHGKTLLGLSAAFNHFTQYPAEDVLVVAPKSILTHWRAEALKWSERGLSLPPCITAADDVDSFQFEQSISSYNTHIRDVFRRKEERQDAFRQRLSIPPPLPRVGHFFVVNFERVTVLRKLCPALKPSLILVDEGHRIGNYNGSLTLAHQWANTSAFSESSILGNDSSEDENESKLNEQARQAALRCWPCLCSMTAHNKGGQRRRTIIFTGTPMQNNTRELYRLVEFIAPHVALTLPFSAYQQKVAPMETFLRRITSNDIISAQHVLESQEKKHFGKEVAEIMAKKPECQETMTARQHEEEQRLFVEAKVAQQFLLEWLRGFMFRGQDAPSEEGISNEKRYRTTDLLIVCNLSSTQQELISKYNLYGAHMAGSRGCTERQAQDNSIPPHTSVTQRQLQLILAASEHRPFHLTAHPATFVAYASRVTTTTTEVMPALGAEERGYIMDLLEKVSRKRIPALQIGKCQSRRPRENSLTRSAGENDPAKISPDRALEILEQRLFGSSTRDAPHPLFAYMLRDSGKLLTAVSIIQRAAVEKKEKIVVVTQYVRIQQLLWDLLSALNIRTAAVSGQDSCSFRDASIESFRKGTEPTRESDGGCNVLLITSRTGSYGLDLTCANHLILFDSWWNPQMDAQAAARIDRKNQTRDVFVYRLATPHEDGIVFRLHAKKLALFDWVVNGEPIASFSEAEFAGQKVRNLDARTLSRRGDSQVNSEDFLFWSALMTAPLNERRRASVDDDNSYVVGLPVISEVRQYRQNGIPIDYPLHN